MPIIASSEPNTLIKSYLSVNIFCKGNGGTNSMDSTLLTVGIFGVIAILAIGMFLKNTITFLKESRQPGDTYEPAPRPQEQPKKAEPKVDAKAKPATVVQPGRRPESRPVAAPAAPAAPAPQPVTEAKPAAVVTEPAAAVEPQPVAAEAAPAVPVTPPAPAPAVEPAVATPQAPAAAQQPATTQSPNPVASATATADDTATAASVEKITTPANGAASKDGGSVVNTDPKITTLGVNQIVMDLETPKTPTAEAPKAEPAKVEAPKAETPEPVKIEAAQPAAPVKAETATAEKAATVKTDKDEKSLVTDTAKNAGRPPIRAQGPKEEDNKRIEKIQDTLAKYFEPQPANDNHETGESPG